MRANLERRIEALEGSIIGPLQYRLVLQFISADGVASEMSEQDAADIQSGAARLLTIEFVPSKDSAEALN